MPTPNNTKTAPRHCGQPVKTGKKTENGATIYAVWCEVCGQRGTGSSPTAALQAFQRQGAPTASHASRQPLRLPQSPDQLPEYVAGDMGQITQLTAPFVSRDKPALQRLINNNVRYMTRLKGGSWDKVWSSPEGQESIVNCFNEAMELGAQLGKMGDVIPYGTVAGFVPAVEAYEFALTQGRTAPFTQIRIDPIYANDQYECFEDEDENFRFRFTSLLADRGDVTGVVVRATDRNERKIGTIYQKDRLLEKAKIHSPGYRRYLQSLNLWKIAESEGKTGVDSVGREYAEVVTAPEDDPYYEQNKARFEEAEAAGELKGSGKSQYAEVTINKKGGGSFTKKIYRRDLEGATKRIYRDEIVNPYDGPDRPEMFRKTAGKSFFSQFIKIRNSVAAMDEMREGDVDPDDVGAVLNSALDKAMGQFDHEGEPPEDINAEYTVYEDGPGPEDPETEDDEPAATSTPQQTTNTTKKEDTGKKQQQEPIEPEMF